MSHCSVSGSDTDLAADAALERLVLVGNPNVGKSVLFGALTGRYVVVSNYPGTTVEITTGTAHLGGRKVAVVDTPGANSFLPSSEDERVTRDILLDDRRQVAVVVGDAKNAERALGLEIQLAEMGIPHILCLNMMDEANNRGFHADLSALAEELGVEVVPTVAVRRRGIARLRSALARPASGRVRVPYPDALEEAVARLEPLLPPASVSSRSLALMVLAGDASLSAWLESRMSPDAAARMEEIRQALRRRFREPVGFVIQQARMAVAREIVARVAGHRRETEGTGRRWAERLERATTHPLWGVPILAFVLFAAYLFVGVLGAGTLVGLMEDGLFGRFLNPWAIRIAGAIIPWGILRDLLVGPYGVITMALTYSLALILPIVTTFFIAFGILEDSGYLPRLAVVVNRLFTRIGLNGKAVLPMVLGLGCDTMATLTTRILETRKERIIVILLLALGVPCSAQLTVILVMLGSLSTAAMIIWLSVVAGVILLVGRLAALVVPGRGSDFVLELPPLRLPGIRNIVVKTLARVEWYLKEAVPLFVLGTFILFVVDRLRILGWMERMAGPVVEGVLGLPKETTAAFIIGFLRRDFGAAGLYHMAQTGALDPVQVVVSAVTITLFIPCIANFFMIVKEQGWKTGAAIAAFIFPFALLVGAALNWVLRALPVLLS